MSKEVLQERIKVAVDAMGGDFAPKEIVEGVNIAIKEHPDLEVKLYGDTESDATLVMPDEFAELVKA